MLFSTPATTPELSDRLAELDELRQQLRHEIGLPARWMGTLRRLVRATSVESSTSIEGFHVSQEEALALVSGDEQPNSEDENQLAVANYGRAMDHVSALAEDPGFRWLDRVILDLHFDSCYFQRDKDPGLWRTGPVGVTAGNGRLLYEAPDPDQVVGLMTEVVDWLQNGDLDTHTVVRAAMAHLHLVSVHPFRDGNGRIARIIQSLVLAREGLLSAQFGSIEDYLGQHTPAYYAALQQVQAGYYQPQRDASRWIDFCVDAHLIQARQRLEQIQIAGARWTILEQQIEKRGWPDRLVIALEQSLIGGTDRSKYVKEAEVSSATATADFRRLIDAGLIEQRGRGRGVEYYASDRLREKLSSALESGR